MKNLVRSEAVMKTRLLKFYVVFRADEEVL